MNRWSPGYSMPFMSISRASGDEPIQWKGAATTQAYFPRDRDEPPLYVLGLRIEGYFPRERG